jgi:hypothetical protein
MQNVTADFDTPIGKATGDNLRYSMGDVRVTRAVGDDVSAFAAATDGKGAAIRRLSGAEMGDRRDVRFPGKAARIGIVAHDGNGSYVIRNGKRKPVMVEATADQEAGFAPVQDILPEVDGHRWVTVDADLLCRIAKAMALSNQDDRPQDQIPAVSIGVPSDPGKPVLLRSADGAGIGAVMPVNGAEEHTIVANYNAVRQQYRESVPS